MAKKKTKKKRHFSGLSEMFFILTVIVLAIMTIVIFSKFPISPQMLLIILALTAGVVSKLSLLPKVLKTKFTGK